MFKQLINTLDLQFCSMFLRDTQILSILFECGVKVELPVKINSLTLMTDGHWSIWHTCNMYITFTITTVTIVLYSNL